MKNGRNLISLSMLCLSIIVAGCGGAGDSHTRSTKSRPESPTQEPGPGIVKHSDAQVQTDRELEILSDRQQTIQQDMKRWRLEMQPTRGPQFEAKESELKAQILENCTKLEDGIRAVSNQKFIIEHRGAKQQLKQMSKFVRQTRNELAGRDSQVH